MGWTWNPASGRNPDDWWAPGIYDFMGVDPYNSDTQCPVLCDIENWADANSTEIAVGEWGFYGTDTTAGQRVHSLYEYAFGNGFHAVTVWDVDQSPGGNDYTLQGERLAAYQSLLADPRTQR
jgi:hypothetical protein